MNRLVKTIIISLIAATPFVSFAAHSKVECVQITLINTGAFNLDFKFQQSDPACGREQHGFMMAGKTKGPFKVSKGSYLRCHAHDGKTKYVKLTKTGVIKSSGTTLINFNCGYVIKN